MLFEFIQIKLLFYLNMWFKTSFRSTCTNLGGSTNAEWMHTGWRDNIHMQVILIENLNEYCFL